MVYLARLPLLRHLVGWIFATMSFALPLHRLRETRTLIAFYHPRPSYAVHILLVPKKALPSLVALTPDDQEFLVDLFQCVQSLVAELNLEPCGYRLVANGGKYQDIPQLHFHLISETIHSVPE
jgi:histidine triad (HIT) family protein